MMAHILTPRAISLLAGWAQFKLDSWASFLIAFNPPNWIANRHPNIDRHIIRHIVGRFIVPESSSSCIQWFSIHPSIWSFLWQSSFHMIIFHRSGNSFSLRIDPFHTSRLLICVEIAHSASNCPLFWRLRILVILHPSADQTGTRRIAVQHVYGGTRIFCVCNNISSISTRRRRGAQGWDSLSVMSISVIYE